MEPILRLCGHITAFYPEKYGNSTKAEVARRIREISECPKCRIEKYHKYNRMQEERRQAAEYEEEDDVPTTAVLESAMDMFKEWR